MRTIESLEASEYMRNLTEKLEIENKNLKDRIAADKICLDYLAEEVVSLREDRARLDDMERLLADKDWPVFAFEYMDNKPVGLTMVRCFEPEYACGNTIRAAIDAMRKEVPRGNL